MAKYSFGFKMEVIEAYVEGAGYKVLAARYGLEQAQIRHWVALYQQHGQVSLRRRKPVQYSADFKHEVLRRMWGKELSTYETAALYGLPDRAIVGRWERLYHEGSIEALMPRPRGRSCAMPVKPPPPPPIATGGPPTHEELLKEIERLRAEVTYLKKRRP